MSSYKLFKSFWANVKGSFSFASLCIVLQQQDCSVGYWNSALCRVRDKVKLTVLGLMRSGSVDGRPWFPGPELRCVRPTEDAETDTDLQLKYHKVSTKPELVQAVPHLRHRLHHGPAMFPSSVHQDRNIPNR